MLTVVKVLLLITNFKLCTLNYTNIVYLKNSIIKIKYCKVTIFQSKTTCLPVQMETFPGVSIFKNVKTL